MASADSSGRFSPGRGGDEAQISPLLRSTADALQNDMQAATAQHVALLSSAAPAAPEDPLLTDAPLPLQTFASAPTAACSRAAGRLVAHADLEGSTPLSSPQSFSPFLIELLPSSDDIDSEQRQLRRCGQHHFHHHRGVGSSCSMAPGAINGETDAPIGCLWISDSSSTVAELRESEAANCGITGSIGLSQTGSTGLLDSTRCQFSTVVPPTISAAPLPPIFGDAAATTTPTVASVQSSEPGVVPFGGDAVALREEAEAEAEGEEDGKGWCIFSAGHLKFEAGSQKDPPVPSSISPSSPIPSSLPQNLHTGSRAAMEFYRNEPLHYSCPLLSAAGAAAASPYSTTPPLFYNSSPTLFMASRHLLAHRGDEFIDNLRDDDEVGLRLAAAAPAPNAQPTLFLRRHPYSTRAVATATATTDDTVCGAEPEQVRGEMAGDDQPRASSVEDDRENDVCAFRRNIVICASLKRQQAALRRTERGVQQGAIAASSATSRIDDDKYQTCRDEAMMEAASAMLIQ